MTEPASNNAAGTTRRPAQSARSLDLPNARQDEWESLGFDPIQAEALVSDFQILGYVRVMEQ